MLGALARAASAPSRGRTGSHRRRANDAREEKVPMTRLRKTIALRLKESQNTAAQLTTFNEVDMTAVMSLRGTYKDTFEKKHGVKLGFMGFFAKAVVAALKELPNVNAEIEGDNIIYKNYYDIGIAVSTESGLVVPVVRDADQLSLAGIEKAIAGFWRPRPRQQNQAGGTAGRHLLHHQWRRVRLADVHPDPKFAPIGHPGHAQDPAPSHGDRRQDRDPSHDVSGAVLRSPHGGWPRSGHLPGQGEGKSGRPAAYAAGRLGFLARPFLLGNFVFCVIAVKIKLFADQSFPTLQAQHERAAQSGRAHPEALGRQRLRGDG